MIPCWMVEVTYETQNGDIRVMQSEPLTFTEARNLVLANERRGHRAILVELEDVTKLWLEWRAVSGGVGGAPRSEVNRRLRAIYDQMPQSRRASRKERQAI